MTPISIAARFTRPNVYAQAVYLALAITTITTWAFYIIGWDSGPLNWYELGATGLNYASFYLAVKQRRANYMLGVVASALFAITFFRADLLASAGLSIYLTFALFIGYTMWGKDSKTLPVKHLELKWVPAYLLVTAVAYLAAVGIVKLLGGSFAFWDSAILIFTLLAQFMLDRKKLENWWVWIIGVNIVGTILYYNTGLYLVAVQQLIFGAFSVWGWFSWRAAMKETSNG